MPDADLAARLADEVHRYFPDWADRPESAGLLRAADHNSYLAGGYSEEFGYRVWPEGPQVFPLLLEDPDLSDQWCVQIGCLHPGYPECPRPAARDRNASGGLTSGERGAALHPSGNMPPRTGITAAVRVDRQRRGRHFGFLVPISSLRARWRIRRELDRPV